MRLIVKYKLLNNLKKLIKFLRYNNNKDKFC